LIKTARPVARDPLAGSVREPLADARERSGLSILVGVDWGGHGPSSLIWMMIDIHIR
jgi:hypothetical protein